MSDGENATTVVSVVLRDLGVIMNVLSKVIGRPASFLLEINDDHSAAPYEP